MTDSRHEQLQATRKSWNAATRIHNLHKSDQAQFFRDGGDVLFPEECELLGSIDSLDVVHLQCNSGQDTLSLARRGARVTGVDLSDEAIGFAQKLATDTGLAASFIEAEVVEWMHQTPERFDVVFASYGATPWIAELDKWFAGVQRILRPQGRFVCVEFHPLVWSFGPDLRPTGDDYFKRGPFVEPVGDYVGESGTSLQSVAEVDATNELPAYSWQYTLGEIVTLAVAAGLQIQVLHEYPFSNGCRLNPQLVAAPGRRWVWPPGIAQLPLMYGLAATRR